MKLKVFLDTRFMGVVEDIDAESALHKAYGTDAAIKPVDEGYLIFHPINPRKPLLAVIVD